MREAAAKVADKHRAYVPDHHPDQLRADLVSQGYGNAALNIAHEIRSLPLPAGDTLSTGGWNSDMNHQQKEPGMSTLTDAQISHMVERFLSWKLPADISPDGGLSFTPTYNNGTSTPARHEPTGTNLLGYTQAEAMVRHMLEALPEPPPGE